MNSISPAVEVNKSDRQSLLRSAVRDILIAIGEDPDREGLSETPRRVAKMYEEWFSGLHIDPKNVLQTTFAEESYSDEIIAVKGIPFFSVCEHHLLPFIGTATICYVPAPGRVVGLSKLARVVDGFARRPQVQERLTAHVAEAVMEELSATGVLVIIEAEHMCMSLRGAQKPGSKTVTTYGLGSLKDLRSRHDTLSYLRGL
ncbi:MULTISPECIES: GTP cyclohydrolase I FolE [unclassified Inquilinus]|uniref:GTP cyclohydrolase I FolE n=1 Tax=unclassified Inquilinus TaxID=2645927 RepID=UPI003F9007DE